MRSDALAALAAYATAVAAAPVTEITDAQALIYAVGAGLAGGTIAGLWNPQTTGREYLLRILSSGLGAPALVWFGYLQYADRLTLMPTVAACGIAGICAWWVLNLLKTTIETTSPKRLREWLARILGVQK